MSEEGSFKHILFAVEDGVGKQADAVEGVRSFLERRPPEWKLRASADPPEWPAGSDSPDSGDIEER